MTTRLRPAALALLGVLFGALPGAELRTFPLALPADPAVARPGWEAEVAGGVPAVVPLPPDLAFASADGIQPLMYEGAPLAGRPTRVFAWLGLPPAGEGPVPGIVLVHGGGGTAFRDWVARWTARGYAAIAMDLYGGVPSGTDGFALTSRRHAHGGATFSGGGFAKSGDPLAEQWVHQAVAAAIRGHNLLRATPGVDAGRIGITGISWGGMLTGLIAGADHRLRFAAPVYGCGFLGEDSWWQRNEFQTLPEAAVRRWLELWDPARHVGAIGVPTLFANGTNDKHFRPAVWQRTAHLVTAPRVQVMKLRLAHNHPAGDLPEIRVFADAVLKGGEPLPQVVAQGVDIDSGAVWIDYAGAVPLRSAELLWTADGGDWYQRRWQAAPAVVDAARRRASAPLDAGATAWVLNLVDARGCTVSGDLGERQAPRP